MNIIAQDLHFAYLLCIFAVHEDSQSGRISSRKKQNKKPQDDCGVSLLLSFNQVRFLSRAEQNIGVVMPPVPLPFSWRAVEITACISS